MVRRDWLGSGMFRDGVGCLSDVWGVMLFLGFFHAVEGEIGEVQGCSGLCGIFSEVRDRLCCF